MGENGGGSAACPTCSRKACHHSTPASTTPAISWITEPVVNQPSAAEHGGELQSGGEPVAAEHGGELVANKHGVELPAKPVADHWGGELLPASNQAHLIIIGDS